MKLDGGRIVKAAQKAKNCQFIRLHFFLAEELDITVGLRSPVMKQLSYSLFDPRKNTEL